MKAAVVRYANQHRRHDDGRNRRRRRRSAQLELMDGFTACYCRWDNILSHRVARLSIGRRLEVVGGNAARRLPEIDTDSRTQQVSRRWFIRFRFVLLDGSHRLAVCSMDIYNNANKRHRTHPLNRAPLRQGINYIKRKETTAIDGQRSRSFVRCLIIHCCSYAAGLADIVARLAVLPADSFSNGIHQAAAGDGETSTGLRRKFKIIIILSLSLLSSFASRAHCSLQTHVERRPSKSIPEAVSPPV